MHDPLFWRLVWEDDSVQTEPLTNAAIADTRSGAVEMHIVKSPFEVLGTGVVRVDLRGGWLPVFYRRRYKDAALDQPVGLSATVFGKVRRSYGAVNDVTLYAAIEGQIVNCPEFAIDLGMIALQAGA